MVAGTEVAGSVEEQVVAVGGDSRLWCLVSDAGCLVGRWGVLDAVL